jgi:hypothetical protein
MLGIANLRGRRVRLLATVVCGCAFSLFGYDQALYGGVASGAPFEQHFNHPSATLTGHIAAIYDIGCLIGSLISVMVAQRLGHRNTIVSASFRVRVDRKLMVDLVSRKCSHCCRSNYSNCVCQCRNVDCWESYRWNWKWLVCQSR